ncbi:MAG: hypothetical protein NC094_07810 [Bacteroidales bacterium]|nr:hypothetical protein [Lachnoclostridium sp.]MCM1385062.1 hypothetical protein [Lachnoclostridium sp.]MCM1465306.1 hypothetical protein [Bacteroidales bacterium]
MKDKKQTAFFLALILCVVLLIVLYMYLYQPYVRKTQSLQSSNQALNTRVVELKQFYAQMDYNKKQIEAMTEEIQETLDRFPADVLEEDALYLALRTQDEGANVRYTSVGVDSREELGVIPEDVVRAAGIEGLEQQLTFNRREAVYNSATGYTSLKNIITSMNNNQEELAIDTVVYTYDAEALSLTGTINVSFYTVSGTGKEYEPRTFKNYPVNQMRSNLFTAYGETTE